ncbi:RNA polymerase sporulation sigma factor SigK [Clostridium sp. AM09-51]|uniref:RNA polymerase sporulation sigma factor SigK n=1 Tax=Pseudoruminococcus massiliensis TaxID=2086583 RepID=UPI000E46E236|nr:RNA polymerase sporulation sigma factor SigK [Pseudoruminococcus massiliensis]RHO50635.1 RNA polymerase sporulation sigma factor SigK [Clostridium sp. AM09-51]
MFDLILKLLNQFSMFFILHVTGVGSFPKPLSAKEERECLLKWKNGDIKARNKLVEHNLRLVAHIAKKYYSSCNDTDELVSIGTIGLIKAVNTFDIDKNIRLSSYASRCIENEVLMYFRNSKKSAQDMSLDDAIDSDSDGNKLTLMDIMSVEEDFVDNLDIKIKSEKLKTYIDKYLTPREKLVITLRYGLDGNDPLTQREIAKKLNISRSYVSRIERKALDTLKTQFM